MAAFSPKDLMNPMQKIASALEDVHKDTSALVSIAAGYTQSVSQTLIAIEENVATIADVLLNISKKMDISIAVKKVGKKDQNSDITKTQQGVEMFKTFGIGIKDFAVGMLLFSLVPKKTAEKLVTNVTDIMNALSGLDKNVADNAAKLGDIGKSIFAFTGWIVLAALLAIPALVAIPIIALEIWLFSKLLGGRAMQKELDNAINATNKLGEIGWSIVVFEACMVLAGLLAVPAAVVMPFVWLTVWGITKILGVLNKAADDILEGALLLTVISVGLIIFSIGLLLFGLAVKTLDWKGILMGVAVIGIIGLACFALGQPAVFPYVLLGAIALTVMTLPLLIFSVSMLMFALTMKLVDDDMPQRMMKLIICLGLAFAAVGIASPLVIAGGVAMLVASTALLVLGVGLLIFSLTLKLLDKEASDRIPGLLIGIGMSFAALGLVAPVIMLGAAAMLLVGVSLLVLGVSLIVFGLSLKVLKPEDQDRIPGLLLTLAGCFSAIGLLSIPIMLGSVATVAMSVSIIVFSIALTLFGLAIRVLKPEDQERMGSLFTSLSLQFSLLGVLLIPISLGSAAMMTMAGALMLISPALLIFKKSGWKEGDGDKLTDAIVSVRNGFLGINKDDGFFAIIKKTAASIAAAGALLAIAPAYVVAGSALVLLTKGLAKVKELHWTEENDVALVKMLASISSAFAQVAEAGTVTKNASFGGLFGKLLGGFSVDKNAVKEGIDSVKGAGKALIDISQGIVEFTKWYENNKKLLDIKDGKSPFFEALKMTITTLSDAFATVGGSDNYVKNNSIFAIFKPEESKVQKGIESVQGLGTTLKDIAEGIIKFTDWYNTAGKKKIEIKEGSPFFTALTTVLTTVAGAFATIGGSDEYIKRDANSFGPFTWDENLVQKGIESVAGVGEALNGMLDGVIKFADFYKKYEKDLVTTQYENVNGKLVPKNGILAMLNLTISSIGKAFASLGGEENEYKSFLFFSGNAVEDGISAVENVDKALEGITKGVQTFVNAGIKEDQINNVTKLITSLGEFGKLAEVDIDDVGDDFDDFSKDFIKGLDRIYKKKDTVTRMKNINVLMLTMERQVRFKTFNKAADGIKKIADAVNTIDVQKGKTFSDLFVAASRLKDNSKFYQDLVKAVEDIRKMLEEHGISDNSNNTNGGNNINNTNNRNNIPAPPPQPTPPPQPPTKPAGKKELKVGSLTITADTVYVERT